MSKLSNWKKIKIAIDELGGKASYKDIRNHIIEKWGDIGYNTLVDQIQAVTVNHNSRIYYPENSKPRLTNTGDKYDFLFKLNRGNVEKYEPHIHGIWEIYRKGDDQLAVKEHKETALQTIYTPTNIVWIKNVTNSVNHQAYLDLTENEFVLNFPTKHKQNVLSPDVNELILIYQKVNGIAAFTHLVTPIDYDLDDKGERPEYKYGRKVRVVAKVKIDDYIPVSSTMWDRINFAGFSQGNVCKIDNISQIESGDELRLEIWQKFRPYFVSDEQQSLEITDALLIEIQITNLTVIEGGLKLVSHFAKERNQTIIAHKKSHALKNNLLHCEICNFSFPKVFNANFIECHHLDPIGEGGVRETKLENLLLVCPNCHRMLHLKFDGQYLTPQQLKERIILLATNV